MNQTSFPFRNKSIGITNDSLHFKHINLSNEVMIPVENHPGAFGFSRRYHTHEGVDLYCHEGEPVHSIEDGIVVKVAPFTGSIVQTPWWENTYAIMIQGESGVLNYGELIPAEGIYVNSEVKKGQLIGNVTRVLKNDKGRPREMLHFELYEFGTREFSGWRVGQRQPQSLRDPTKLLIDSAIETADGSLNILKSLEMRWISAFLHYAPLEVLRECFLELTAPYQSPQRHYHNLKHLHAMLNLLDKFENQLSNPKLLMLATFVHDLVCVAGEKDNEIRSSEKGAPILRKIGFDESVITRVEELTLLTSKHQYDAPSDLDSDSRIFLGADLAILGAEAEIYDQYVKNIFLEFENVGTPSDQIDRRKHFIQKLLTKKSILPPSPLADSLGEQVRDNLFRELSGYGRTK